MGPVVKCLHDNPRLVELHRGGRVWPVPFDLTLRKGELEMWGFVDTFYADDRLTLAETPHPICLRLGVAEDRDALPADRLWFDRTHSPLVVGVSVFSRPPCPACATVASHHVDIPSVTRISVEEYFIRRFVVRTCIACDTSWQQEGM